MRDNVNAGHFKHDSKRMSHEQLKKLLRETIK